jgi:hypothetical protein
MNFHLPVVRVVKRTRRDRNTIGGRTWQGRCLMRKQKRRFPVRHRSSISSHMSLLLQRPHGSTMPLPHGARYRNGRYWARTSDPQLVELVLSQLS